MRNSCVEDVDDAAWTLCTLLLATNRPPDPSLLVPVTSFLTTLRDAATCDTYCSRRDDVTTAAAVAESWGCSSMTSRTGDGRVGGMMTVCDVAVADAVSENDDERLLTLLTVLNRSGDVRFSPPVAVVAGEQSSSVSA